MNHLAAYFELAFLSVATCVALIGNALVVVVIWRSPRTTWMTNLFVGHMGAANLIVPVVCCPVYIYCNVHGYWPEDISCKAVLFFNLVNSFVSVFMLACMSLDRYFVIVHPLSVHLSSDETMRLIKLVWILSAAASCPVLYFAFVDQVCDDSYCAIPSAGVGWKVFFGLYFALTVALPRAFILLIDIRIVVAIRKRNSTLTLTSRKSRDLGRVPRVKQQTTKLMIMQDIVYLLCWLPYFSKEIYQFTQKEGFRTPDWLVCVAFSPAALNPVLYAIFCSNFRRGCKHLLHFCVARPYSVYRLRRVKNQISISERISDRKTQTQGSVDYLQRDSLFGIRINASGPGIFSVQASIESRFKSALSVADRRQAWVN